MQKLISNGLANNSGFETREQANAEKLSKNANFILSSFIQMKYTF